MKRWFAKEKFIIQKHWGAEIVKISVHSGPKNVKIIGLGEDCSW